MVDLEAKIELNFRNKKDQKDDEQLAESPSVMKNKQTVQDKEDEKSDTTQKDKEKKDIVCTTIPNELSKGENQFVKESSDTDSNSSVSSLLVKCLKSSNHQTLMDVYEKFLSEIFNEKSDLHAFIRSNSKMNFAVRENCSLQKIELLVTKVLKFLAATEDSNPKTHVFDEFEVNHNVLMSPLTTRTQQTSRGMRNEKSPKTPISIFRSKHNFSPLSATPVTPNGAVERQEVQKKFIENIFRCYLHLLVNTRCELALAFVFNIPDRELNHEAFTHLKHASTSYGLSMYQTLSSMLMRIRLGGHGSVPTSDSPLMVYIKGLSNLYDFIDKLQTVIEESASSRSACKRVVNILKRTISSCKTGKFPYAVVECVANRVWDTMDDVLGLMEKCDKKDSSENSVSEGGSVLGQGSIDVILTYLDQTATFVSDVDRYLLRDVRFSQDTPTRFPCLMSQFRSPMADMGAEGEGDQDEQAAVMDVDCTRQKFYPVSEALYLNSDDNDHVISSPLDLNKLYVIPSKTIVHPKCGADYGEIKNDLFSPVKNIPVEKCSKKQGQRKRSKKAEMLNVVDDQENKQSDDKAPSSKSFKSAGSVGDKMDVMKDAVGKKEKTIEGNKKQNKSCRRKLLPQVKGQSKITGFFKV